VNDSDKIIRIPMDPTAEAFLRVRRSVQNMQDALGKYVASLEDELARDLRSQLRVVDPQEEDHEHDRGN
jgi:hypothetical protein